MNNNLVKNSIIKVIKNNIKIDALLILSVIAVVGISLVAPQLLRIIIDGYLLEGKSDGILLMATAYLGAMVFVGIFNFLKEAVLTVLGQKITKEIRIEMMEKLGKINSKYFSANESGIIVSRFTNDVDTINSLFTGGIIGMVIDLFKIVGIIISIWIFSSLLGLIVLLILPVIAVITRIFQKNMLKAQLKNRVIIGKVNNHISESFKNIQMIKIFGKENYMENKYTGYLEENFNSTEKVNLYDSIFSPIIMILRAAVIAVIVILCAKDLNILGISIGMAAASIELISKLFEPVENLGMELQNIQQSVSGIRRVNEFGNETEDGLKNNSYKTGETLANSEVNISFNNVCFSYEEGIPVLDSVNFLIKPRGKVTFIGRTGEGKSTLFKLVMGLIEPTEGNITINGIDVYDIPNFEKRKIFGYVEQDFHIIKGTVAEQISLKDENISLEQIKKALEYVGLSDYIESLEKGYDTVMKDDNVFSQGQKQLLGIARAIVSDPPILLLDEITANLDSITEEKIVSVLEKAVKSRTILSISHRLASLKTGGRIILIKNGKVAGEDICVQREQSPDFEKLNW